MDKSALLCYNAKIEKHIDLTQQTDKLEFGALAAKPPLPLPLGEVPP